MSKIFILITMVAAAVLFTNANSFAKEEAKMAAQGGFEKVYEQAQVKDGIKEISYDQFMQLRNSGEKFLLLDVLDPESYSSGHIEGAESFPLASINKDSAAAKLSEGSNIIVYCGSFQCRASTEAARRLSALGYKTLDYKGGLKEWQEKGNKLTK